VFDAWCDFKDFTTRDRWFGILGSTAILNHALKHEPFDLTNIHDEGTRVGFWGKSPAYQEAVQSATGKLFLISLKAGGLGLNLTAADYVIHMDPWWNPAVEDQASDRAHRLGQQRPVTIYRFITQGTIEQKILQLHASKRDLADSLLEGADISGKLSAEALLKLVRE
jgi:hypothetical protein